MKGIEVEITSLAGGSDVDMRKRATLHLADSFLTPELQELEDRDSRPLGC